MSWHISYAALTCLACVSLCSSFSSLCEGVRNCQTCCRQRKHLHLTTAFWLFRNCANLSLWLLLANDFLRVKLHTFFPFLFWPCQKTVIDFDEPVIFYILFAENLHLDAASDSPHSKHWMLLLINLSVNIKGRPCFLSPAPSMTRFFFLPFLWTRGWRAAGFSLHSGLEDNKNQKHHQKFVRKKKCCYSNCFEKEYICHEIHFTLVAQSAISLIS